MANRPTTSPLWCTNNPSNLVVPPSSEVATGYAAGEPLPAEYLNANLATLGSWVAYLDEQGTGTQLASTLDFSTRLIGGGQWSWSGTTLAWSAAAYIAIPSAADANNTIAAGSVSIPANSVAFVTANQPFSTTGTTTSGSTQVTGVIYGDLVRVGQAVSGAGIPSGTAVQTVGSAGATVTLSKAATASASGVTLTFASSGTLTVQVTPSATLVPGPNTVVLARAVDDTCIVGVGSGQMLLRQGEVKRLLGHGFVVSKSVTCGQAISTGVPLYLSPGSSDGGRTAGVAFVLDATTAGSAVRATFAGFAALAAASNATTSLVSAGVLGGFSGLTPGAVYYASGTTSGAITATAPTGVGQFVVPVGLAMSATELMVVAGTAPARVGADLTAGVVTATSVTTTGGFKSVVSVGTFTHSQASSGVTYPTFQASVDVQTGTAGRLPFALPATHSGSIVGISARTFGPSGGTMSVLPQKNGVNFDNGNGGPVALASSTNGSSRQSYTRNFMPFAAGDVLTCNLTFGASGSQLCELFFTLELTSA